jgi:hypothetical protein
MADAVPPRFLILVADWSNVLAGIVLDVAFLLVVLFTYGYVQLADVGYWINFTFFLEGVFWAIAAATLVKVNLMVNNASLAVVQTIICFGGIFFTISGLGGVPGKVISVNYVVPLDDHAHFVDACPFYGITCFMVATTMGLNGVWPLPRNQIISPFWAVACMFIGAWIIGVFGFWGPCLAGGLAHYEDEGVVAPNMPTFKWGWTHLLQLLGALFLTAGCIIFGIMDQFWRCVVDSNMDQKGGEESEDGDTDSES